MPFINGLLKKKGLQQLVQNCYLDSVSSSTVEMLDALKDLGFTYATRSGLSIGIDDLVIPGRQAPAGRRRARRSHRGREAVPGRRDHQRRALQQDHRGLVGGHREDRRRDVRRDGPSSTRRAELQPGVHHGRLGRTRLEAADPPAGGHARSDGEAVGRDHRDADHVELPRRPHRAAVLHLDARRAQGPGGYGAQDGGLGLPDAPSGGRGAGRHHLRARLRHDRRHRGAVDRRIAARSSSRCATASWAA